MQFAPLWMVDYVIVGWLLRGGISTRAGQRIHRLLGARAFTAGVFYMALFASLAPHAASNVSPVLLSLMAGLLLASVAGLALAWLAIRTRVD